MWAIVRALIPGASSQGVARRGSYSSEACPNENCRGAAANAKKDEIDRKGDDDEDSEYDGVDCSCDEWRDFQRRNSVGMEGFEEFIRAEGLRPCPECFAVGELKSGCKFVYCTCKNTFCYLCGRSLSEEQILLPLPGWAVWG